VDKCLIPRIPAAILAGFLVVIAILHGSGVCSADLVGSALPLFCPFKALTGVPCPGCGMTHALVSVAKGDFHSALIYNPFSFFLVFMTALSVIPRRRIEKVPPGLTKCMELSLVAVLVSLLLFWACFRLAPALT
jgi:hypothetical protein